jgi:hypothetical protein
MPLAAFAMGGQGRSLGKYDKEGKETSFGPNDSRKTYGYIAEDEGSSY